MEGTGMPLDASRGVDGMPLGFGMALAMNERAMTRYADLTEAEKERIILRCKDAKSKEEMDKIVNSLIL